MSSVHVSSERAAGAPPGKAGEVKLEVVVGPVSDVDRAKHSYEALGWRLDADLTVDDGYRVVQLKPPGSASGSLKQLAAPGDQDAASEPLKGGG
jgi:hypothetical protein